MSANNEILLSVKNKKIKTCEIPETIKKIGNSAFAQCINLKSVKIPDSVVSIEHSAFFGCAQLSINIPDNVSFIGECAFNRVKSVKLSEKNKRQKPKKLLIYLPKIILFFPKNSKTKKNKTLSQKEINIIRKCGLVW